MGGFKLNSKNIINRYLEVHNLASRLPIDKALEALSVIGFKQTIEVALAARVEGLDAAVINNIWQEGPLVKTERDHIILANQWHTFSGSLEPINEEELVAHSLQLSRLLKIVDMDGYPLYQLAKEGVLRKLKESPKTKQELLKRLTTSLLKELSPSKREMWSWPSDTQEASTLGDEILEILFPIVVASLPVSRTPRGGAGEHCYAFFEKKQTAEECVKKYLKGYGPATSKEFALWANIPPIVGERLWNTLSPREVVEVNWDNQSGLLLREDFESLSRVEENEGVRFIGPDDPLLALPYRSQLIQGKKLQGYFFGSNKKRPGVVLSGTEAVAGWHLKLKRNSLTVQIEEIGLALGRIAVPEIEVELEKLATALGIKSKGFSVSY